MYLRSPCRLQCQGSLSHHKFLVAKVASPTVRCRCWFSNIRYNYGGTMTRIVRHLLTRTAVLLVAAAALVSSVVAACGSGAASLLPEGTTTATVHWTNSGSLGPNSTQPIGGEVAGKKFQGTAYGSGNCPERISGHFDNMSFHGSSICVGPIAFSHYLITGKIGDHDVRCNLWEHIPLKSSRDTFKLSCTTNQGLRVTSNFQMMGGDNPIKITIHVT